MNDTASTEHFHMEEINCILCGGCDKKTLFSSHPHKVVTCVSCGLIYNSPRPSRHAHLSFHGEENFKQYYKMGIEEFYTTKNALYQQEVLIKTKRFELVENVTDRQRTLLDVGMGQGLFLSLAKECGYDVYGTDVSEHVCAFLSRRGIHTFCGYVEDAHFPSGFFDIVTLWHVIEHTLNPLATLWEVYRVLKEGGALILALPDVTALEILARKLLNKPLYTSDMNEMHLFHFNSRTIAQLILKAGFNILSLEKEPDYLNAVKNPVSALRKYLTDNRILIFCRKGS